MASLKFTFDGITFNILHEGEPSRPLILLSHALMANLHMWDSTVPFLHRLGYSTLRYDALGHGKTSSCASRPIPNLTFEDFTKHMHKLVHAVTGSQQKLAAVIGCSMGGVLAMRYAMLYPSFVDKVICCDAPGMTTMEAMPKMWQERVAKFEAGGKEELCQATVSRWLPGDDDESQVARHQALEMVRSCSFEGYKACAYAISNFDYHAHLKEVRVKAMVLVGELDSAVGPPEVLRDVAKQVPGCEYVMLGGAGHLPPLQRPDKFNAVVQRFLSQAE
jgi:3-oxoadipate enol-lactonase